MKPRQGHSHFIRVFVWIVPLIEIRKLQHYLEARKHIKHIRRLVPEQCEVKDGDARLQLLDMLRQALQIDVEAVLHLKVWDELDEIVKVVRHSSPK